MRREFNISQKFTFSRVFKRWGIHFKCVDLLDASKQRHVRRNPSPHKKIEDTRDLQLGFKNNNMMHATLFC